MSTSSCCSRWRCVRCIPDSACGAVLSCDLDSLCGQMRAAECQGHNSLLGQGPGFTWTGLYHISIRLHDRSHELQHIRQRSVLCCSSCRSSCSSRGGTSSGSSYTTFECIVLEQPSGVCVRVRKDGESWTAATGTLPDRTTGASGAGAPMYSLENLSPVPATAMLSVG